MVLIYVCECFITRPYLPEIVNHRARTCKVKVSSMLKEGACSFTVAQKALLVSVSCVSETFVLQDPDLRCTSKHNYGFTMRIRSIRPSVRFLTPLSLVGSGGVQPTTSTILEGVCSIYENSIAVQYKMFFSFLLLNRSDFFRLHHP